MDTAIEETQRVVMRDACEHADNIRKKLTADLEALQNGIVADLNSLQCSMNKRMEEQIIKCNEMIKKIEDAVTPDVGPREFAVSSAPVTPGRAHGDATEQRELQSASGWQSWSPPTRWWQSSGAEAAKGQSLSHGDSGGISGVVLPVEKSPESHSTWNRSDRERAELPWNQTWGRESWDAHTPTWTQDSWGADLHAAYVDWKKQPHDEYGSAWKNYAAWENRWSKSKWNWLSAYSALQAGDSDGTGWFGGSEPDMPSVHWPSPLPDLTPQRSECATLGWHYPPTWGIPLNKQIDITKYHDVRGQYEPWAFVIKDSLKHTEFPMA